MAYGSFYDQLLAATGKGAANYSLYAIPAMWVVSVFPHVYAVVALSDGKFKNSQPREYNAMLLQKEKKTAKEAMFARAEGASLNGFESMPFFAVAILAANFAKLPAEELNTFAGAYIASRALFNFLYINVSSEPASILRSASYFIGIAINFTLIIRSGQALN